MADFFPFSVFFFLFHFPEMEEEIEKNKARRKRKERLDPIKNDNYEIKSKSGIWRIWF